MEPAKECTLIEDYIIMWTSLLEGSSKDHVYHQSQYFTEIECIFCKKTLEKKLPISISQDLWITWQKDWERPWHKKAMTQKDHDTKRILQVHGTLKMTVKGLEDIQQNYKGHFWAVARAPIFHKTK